MRNDNKTIISWSSGKDSAFALYQISQQLEFTVVGLLTTVTENYNRVAMHGVREELLELQAERLDLPLYKITIPENCTDAIYKNHMENLILELQQQDISHMIFGDIFLEDIRQYREQQLQETAIKPIFPLWGQDSHTLAEQVINLGFKAIITCVDTRKLSADLVGHEYDLDFINSLPEGVDPCGENGEFHTFVYDAPMFSSPIDVVIGVTRTNANWVFVDVKSVY